MIKKINNRFCYILDNSIRGYVEYEVCDKVVIVTHTFVDESLRGQGIAYRLMDEFFNYFNDDYQIIGKCSYAKKWLDDRKINI